MTLAQFGFAMASQHRSLNPGHPDWLLPVLADARVLLVDDDLCTIQWLTRLLSGYSELRFATDGEQALTIARSWLPELILLDAEMPGMDGFEVCRRLRRDPLLADVPVIFIVRHTDEFVETTVFELGAADFITKPVAGPAMRARVAMQLRLHRTAQNLLRLAGSDALTGLIDRAHFDEELTVETRRARYSGQPMALLLAELEGLPEYRQRLGRTAADKVMRHVAQLARQALKRPADLLARHSEDVLALLLPDTDACGATALARRLCQVLAEPMAGRGVHGRLSMRLALGLGLLPTGAGDLAGAAKAALDEARATRASGAAGTDVTSVLQLCTVLPGGGLEAPFRA